jgi:anti-sigma-K factor RskA/putative zinc finger protein
MGHDDIHGLTAAYALDALDEAEVRDYEEHLRDCPRCREELSELSQAAASLPYAVAAPPPPPALRQRILDDARRERSTVIPFRARRTLFAAAGLAAVAACAAIGLGFWAFSLQDSLDDERDASRATSLAGGRGQLIVGDDRSAVLVLYGVPAAPKGKDYEAWVATDGTVDPAGVFEGGRERVVTLDKPVPPGATVMVTLEKEGGVAQPEGKPLFRAAA